MAKLRVQLTKGEEIRYIGHLDYARAIERALRRAKLPVAYTEGFNPHMKISFASALAVGVTSRAEYVDIEFTKELTVAEFKQQLVPQLPPGIKLVAAAVVKDRGPSLTSLINRAAYNISVPLVPDVSPETVHASIAAFNAAGSAFFVRETPKGRREINIKEYIAQPVISTLALEKVILAVTIKLTPTGSVKPTEVLTVLVQQFGLPAQTEAALVEREGLYIEQEGQVLSPLSI